MERHPYTNLSEAQRGVIVGMYEEGRSQAEIAEEVQCERHTVSRWIQKYQLGGLQALKDHRKRNRGFRKTTAEEDRLIINSIDENPFASAANILRQTNLNICKNTFINRLKEVGVRSRRPVKKISLTEDHRRTRLNFAHRYLNTPQEEWNAVIWMDEKVFSTAEEGRTRVWRPNGSFLDPRYVLRSTQSGRIVIGYWGSMTSSGLMDIIEISSRMDAEEYVEILEDVLKPSARRIYPENQYPVIKIVQDNSGVHRSRLVQAWFDANPGFEKINWPPKSPHLNPIENVWSQMTFRSRAGATRTREELRNFVNEIWNDLTRKEGYTQNLVNSMRRRLELVIENDGYWIPYW